MATKLDAIEARLKMSSSDMHWLIARLRQLETALTTLIADGDFLAGRPLKQSWEVARKALKEQ